jgi:hypothetical protein
MNKYTLILTLGIVINLSACNSGPKVISTPVSPEASSQESTGIFSGDVNTSISSSTPVSNDVHTVKVLEVLPTSKYVYIKVDENGEEFWIATSKKEVAVGETYFYKNGILKTNFESKEYNRIFDKVYLVANIVPASHGSDPNTTTVLSKDISEPQTSQKIEIEGSIKISELVNNKRNYEGKEVQISGKCTKLNPNIMDRNWIHLKDGSMDEFDLVITSDVAVPEGHIVTMKGFVVLDKDFGAGYKYDLIIENGQIVNSNN